MTEQFAIEVTKTLNAFLAEVQALRAEVQDLRNCVETQERFPSDFAQALREAEPLPMVLSGKTSAPAAFGESGVPAAETPARLAPTT